MYKDENNQWYLRLRKEVDPILERKQRIISLPLDLVVALQSGEALSQISLCSKEGKIIETSIEENAVWELMYFGKSSADIKYKSKKSHN